MNQLDYPVWNALSELQSAFCVDFSSSKFYDPDYCPFGAISPNYESSVLAESFRYKSPDFFLVGELPKLLSGMSIEGTVLCNQMVMDQLPEAEFTEDIVQLNGVHEQELFNLVNLVQPGYFRNKTSRLGDYFGIFKDGRLAAVTGERMKMNGFSEISAVVAHPDYHRKGYAKQLVFYTAAKIIKENKVPFLHVSEVNASAIRLYERLGFRFRRKMNFWKIKQNL